MNGPVDVTGDRRRRRRQRVRLGTAGDDERHDDENGMMRFRHGTLLNPIGVNRPSKLQRVNSRNFSRVWQ